MTRVKSGGGVMSFCRDRWGAARHLLPFLSQVETLQMLEPGAEI
jgi:hypothetical protein